MKELVKLAEAIWPDKKIYHLESGRDDGGYVGYNNANGTFHVFNPYKDANDDYEVLEWMRKYHREELRRVLTKLRCSYQWNYKIGYYTGAALEIIK